MLLALHSIDRDPKTNNRLKSIIEEMRILGFPTIRVAKIGSDYFALEGCHRLVAAEYLNLVPKIKVLSKTSDAKWNDITDQDYIRTVQDILEYYSDTSTDQYSFNPKTKLFKYFGCY